MRVLVLQGSLRRGGNTDRLADLFLERLEAALGPERPVEIRRLVLGEEIDRLCRGCRLCFDRGEDSCPLKDGTLVVRRAMREADLLVVASPIYVGDVGAAVKNWLDRLAFICHRPEFAGKLALLITSTGSAGTFGHAFHTLGTGLTTWGYRIIGKAEFIAGALSGADELARRYGRRLDALAAGAAAWLSGRRRWTPGFLSLLAFRVQQDYYRRRAAAGRDGAGRESADGRYWRESGWTAPDCKYYIEHRASPLKTAAARTLGALVAKLMG